MTKPSADFSVFQALTEIGIIQQLSTNQLEQNLPDDLKASQFAVLNHLARLGGDWSPLRLASAMQVTKGAMTNTLTRLEKRGLVSVVEDPNDGRKKIVSITKEGLKVRETSISSLGPLFGQLLTEIPESEFVEALPFLRKLREFLDNNR